MAKQKKNNSKKNQNRKRAQQQEQGGIRKSYRIGALVICAIIVVSLVAAYALR